MNTTRQKHRRWTRAAACFVLGCLTTVAVSVGQAWASTGQHVRPPDHRVARSADFREGQVWVVNVYSTRGVGLAYAYRTGESLREARDGVRERRERAEEDAAWFGIEAESTWEGGWYVTRMTGPGDFEPAVLYVERPGSGLPWWQWAPPAASVAGVERLRIATLAWGWPLKSMAADLIERDWMEDCFGSEYFEVARGIGLGEAEYYSPRRARVIPTRPLWRGILVNGIVFAPGWLLLLYGPGTARRRVRAWRGRCPRCNYDLRTLDTETCPECGSARAGRP